MTRRLTRKPIRRCEPPAPRPDQLAQPLELFALIRILVDVAGWPDVLEFWDFGAPESEHVFPHTTTTLTLIEGDSSGVAAQHIEAHVLARIVGCCPSKAPVQQAMADTGADVGRMSVEVVNENTAVGLGR